MDVILKNTLIKRLIILSSLLLTACSPIELYQAKSSYEEAKTAKDQTLILTSLQILTALEPQLYKSKYDEAQSAVLKLQKAKLFIVENNLYSAYLASHDSYRKLPTKESKRVLINIGGRLKYLLDVQANIKKSFDVLPSSLSDILSKYQSLSVLEWDIIKINTIIEQLSLAAKAIDRALIILDREKSATLPHEINEWKLALQNQLAMINQMQSNLINLSLLTSVNVLEKLNNQLAETSANLLGLVHEKLAEKTMTSYFIKAQQEYQPYYILNENLSLASSTARKNIHAKWYHHWNHLESTILKSGASFSLYPTKYAERSRDLKLFKKSITTNTSDSTQGFSDLSSFKGSNWATYQLVDKLDRDRQILDYGLSDI